MSYVDELRNNEYIREKKLNNGISSYNFTNKAFYDKVWNAQTVKARGLFCRDDEIVARSYDKFFAVDELPETEEDFLFSHLDYPVQVYRKENGFLGIVSYDHETDSMFISSKSTNEGDFAKYFKSILCNGAYDLNALRNYLKQNNVSAVFEVIDVQNDPHIVEYNESHIILLDVIYNDFVYEHIPFHDLLYVAVNIIGCKVKKWMRTIYSEDEMREMYIQMKNEKDIEGYVCEDEFGYMFKVKTNWYKYWKRMRSVVQAIARGKSKAQIIGRYRINKNDMNLYSFLEKYVPVYMSLYGEVPSIISMRKMYKSHELIEEIISLHL